MQDSSRSITGIGADINMPAIGRAVSVSNYLETQDFIKFGYGSSLAISDPLPSITKVICMLNLISVLSPEEGLESIMNAAKSLKTGDVLILTIHTNDSRTIEHVTGANIPEGEEKTNWAHVSGKDGIDRYNTRIGTLSDVGNGLLQRGLISQEYDFDPNIYSTQISGDTEVNQELTFYSKKAITSILKKLGFSIESHHLQRGQNTGTQEDEIQRITIAAKKSQEL
jgi:hypothetical protein